jgi:hypothetical protein
LNYEQQPPDLAKIMEAWQIYSTSRSDGKRPA